MKKKNKKKNIIRNSNIESVSDNGIFEILLIKTQMRPDNGRGEKKAKLFEKRTAGERICIIFFSRFAA